MAEFIGILLGDGNIYIQESTGNYQIRIAFDAIKEIGFLKYVNKLIEKLFDTTFYTKYHRTVNVMYLCKGSKEICSGLKIILPKNRIPNWIFQDSKMLSSCIRGLIDTDGSIFRMSRKDPHLLRIGFKNTNQGLLKDFKNGLEILGYHPSKIICKESVFLSRQGEIKKYIKDIRFNNPKHIKRYRDLAP
ncbi:MAG: hypothetical protein GOV02_00890 [Candidatus Aenigmarchaeota archaeon]|nr:hypothetical protein [Candidatus Aenigmarchaeota archaeon]